MKLTRADLEKLSPTELQQLLERLEQMEQDRATGKVPWLCSVPDCDGKPHKGRRGLHARASQRPPTDPDWDTWMLLAGRGFGKTRTGAEWVIDMARKYERGALIGPTAADTRDILVEGESGIIASAPAAFRPVYEPSKRKLTYPNGHIQMLYSADEPERLRGPQHHYAWCDELAAWRRLQHAWDMMQMGMRLGDHPRVCITTTPKPLKLVKELLKDDRCRTTRGTTYDNLDNLAPTFRRAVVEKYEGTTLGRQELHADVLDDLPGALVGRKFIDAHRVTEAPPLARTYVGLDPAGTGTGDETGIVVAGTGLDDGHAYVFADESGRMSARESGLLVWRLFYEYGADGIVYEDNFGKQWLRDGLIDAFADYHDLDPEDRRKLRTEESAERTTFNPYPYLVKVTAQHGKKLRAQPVAMRYEQGKVHHVGYLTELEDQLTTWIPEEDPDSPDRIDAMVHNVTKLMKMEVGVVSAVLPMLAGGRR